MGNGWEGLVKQTKSSLWRTFELQSLSVNWVVCVETVGSEDLKLPPAPRMSDQERERRRKIEDELKDSRNFIDYLAPRPIRR